MEDTTNTANTADTANSTKRDKINNESGMALLEVLTAIVILSMVTTILCSFLFMGISVYNRVTEQTQIRNQGDVIMSQLISELKDAVYVSPGELENEIHFVRRAYKEDGQPDTEQYVVGYSMIIEPIDASHYGIGVYKDELDELGGKVLLKRIDLTDAYTIRVKPAAPLQPVSTLTVSNYDMVHVHLVYEKVSDHERLSASAENPDYEIDTRIPLFRSE